MLFFRRLKQLILQTDFFYSTEMLRYDAELQYKTFTGGIISLGIIITILVGFANMILSTLDLSSITTSTDIIKNKDPPASTIRIAPDSPFRFAIQLWHLNLSDTKRYFDVKFEHWYWQNGNRLSETDVPLYTCTKQYFSNYPEITESFDKLGAGNWLCPSLNTTMQISGKYSSQKYSEYVTMVSACNNDTHPAQPCASPQEIQAYMDAAGGYIYYTIYFTNTQINPDKKNYKQYYIQDKSYSIFGSNMGSESFLYFTDYTVSTDYSIWPFTNIVEDKGTLVENLAVNHPFPTDITNPNNTFVYFAFVKGADSIVYSREVQKLSAVFSFMGGMIGALSTVFFFIKVYTSLAYEFSIAFEIFRPGTNHEHSEQPRKVISFNFFNFIRYYFYVFLRKLGLNCEWPEIITYAKQCRSEILKQLDVKALLKRIIFIQHCLNYMIQDYQLDALQIKKPTKPQQIKLIRQKFQSVINNDLNISNYPSEFQSELKVGVFEPAEQISEATPSDIALMMRQPKLQKSVSFKFEDISGAKGSDRSKAEKSLQLQDDIAIFDIDKVKEREMTTQAREIKTPKQNEQGQKNKVKDEYELVKKRSTYLSKLKQAAEEGNQMSNKIWKHLNDMYDIRMKKN